VATIQQGQQGNLTAAKLILESQVSEKWMKPERDVLLRLASPEIDVRELHQRLKAIDAGGAGAILDVPEVEDE
jgi:hypothetical protein